MRLHLFQPQLSLQLAVAAGHLTIRDQSVYLDTNRTRSDLGARASFFTGDANQRLRIFRARSEGLISSLPAFSAIVGSAKNALAYDLAMQQ